MLAKRRPCLLFFLLNFFSEETSTLGKRFLPLTTTLPVFLLLPRAERRVLLVCRRPCLLFLRTSHFSVCVKRPQRSGSGSCPSRRPCLYSCFYPSGSGPCLYVEDLACYSYLLLTFLCEETSTLGKRFLPLTTTLLVFLLLPRAAALACM